MRRNIIHNPLGHFGRTTRVSSLKYKKSKNILKNLVKNKKPEQK